MARAVLTWGAMEVPAAGAISVDLVAARSESSAGVLLVDASDPNDRRAVLTHAVMEVPEASGAVSVDLVAARSESSAGSLSVGAPPAAPTGVSATTQSATEILVEWTAPNDAALDVRVYRRKQGETDWVFVAQAPSTDLDYLDIELDNATTYEYHLTAWDGSQESDPSSTVSDTTTGGTALVSARSEASAGTLSVQTAAASTSLVSASSDSRAGALSVSTSGSPVSVDLVAARSESSAGVLSTDASGPSQVDLVAASSESRAGTLSVTPFDPLDDILVIAGEEIKVAVDGHQSDTEELAVSERTIGGVLRSGRTTERNRLRRWQIRTVAIPWADATALRDHLRTPGKRTAHGRALGGEVDVYVRAVTLTPGPGMIEGTLTFELHEADQKDWAAVLV